MSLVTFVDFGYSDDAFCFSCSLNLYINWLSTLWPLIHSLTFEQVLFQKRVVLTKFDIWFYYNEFSHDLKNKT
jgi:hypothetical protein